MKLKKYTTKDGLFKASPTTNVKLPNTRKDRWSVAVYPMGPFEDYCSLEKNAHFPKALKDQGKRYMGKCNYYCSWLFIG